MSLIIRNGWKNFIRNSYLSIGTVGVIFLSVILSITLIGLRFLTTQIIADLEGKVDVSVYFATDATLDQIMQLKDSLSKNEHVAKVEYVSRDDALSDFKKRHAQDDLIQESLRQLEENPLGASLNILAKNSTQYAAIVEMIEKNPQRSSVDKISYYENKTVIEKIQSLAAGINSWGAIAIGLLSVIAIFIAFNTIRLTIYSQRREIEIMRLVGASTPQIRGPYVVEGALYGFFAAILSLAVFYPTIGLASTKINAFTAVDLYGYFTSNILETTVIALAVGVFLGTISSSIAIRRYLK